MQFHLRQPRLGFRFRGRADQRSPHHPHARPRSRARARLLVHETGNLTGEFEPRMDLGPTTMKALGQFLIDLAEQCEPATSPGE